MSDDNVDNATEKQLIADIAAIKQKQEHADERAETVLNGFNEVKDLLQSLIIDVKELTNKNSNAHLRVDGLNIKVDKYHEKSESNFKDQGRKIAALEKWRIAEETKADMKNKSVIWWSNNWFKLIAIAVMAIPVVVAIHNLINNIN